MTVHPHPRRCRAFVFSSPPSLPFVSSRPEVVSSHLEVVGAAGNGWVEDNQPRGHFLRFRLVGKEWAGIRHEKRTGGARFSCLRGGVSHGVYGNGYGGEGGVSTYIQCNNQKKTNLLWGWVRRPIPTLVFVARARSRPHPASPSCCRVPGSGCRFRDPCRRHVVSWTCRLVSWVVVQVLGDGGRRGTWSW